MRRWHKPVDVLPPPREGWHPETSSISNRVMVRTASGDECEAFLQRNYHPEGRYIRRTWKAVKGGTMDDVTHWRPLS